MANVDSLTVTTCCMAIHSRTSAAFVCARISQRIRIFNCASSRLLKSNRIEFDANLISEHYRKLHMHPYNFDSNRYVIIAGQTPIVHVVAVDADAAANRVCVCVFRSSSSFALHVCASSSIEDSRIACANCD